MSKYGDTFYVKTYGPTHREVNTGKTKKNKGPQKFLVYWRKHKVADFTSRVQAIHECVKLNADLERNVAIVKAKIEADKLEKMGTLTLSAVKLKLGELRAITQSLAESLDILLKKVARMEKSEEL